MQPDISYPQQVLDHFYHPSRWVTFTRHAYVTPGSGVGPQVGKRALIATTVGGPLSLSSGYSRTGHTGHTARLASKLARLANRLPGTNVPGWNFGWPTPQLLDARPTLLIFRVFFSRLIFPRFSLAYSPQAA